MVFFAGTIPSAPVESLDAGGDFTDTFSIDSPADVDLVGVELVAGDRYIVDVDGGGDTMLRIFDAAGNEIKFEDDNSRIESPSDFESGVPYTQLIADYTGTYYFGLSNFWNRDYDAVTGARPYFPANSIAASGTGTLRVETFETNADWPDANVFSNFSTTNNEDTDSLDDLTTDFVTPGVQRRIAFQDPQFAGASDPEIGRLGLEKGDILVVEVVGLSGFDPRAEFLSSPSNSLATSNGFNNGTNNVVEFDVVAPFDSSAFYLGITAQGADIVENPSSSVFDFSVSGSGTSGSFLVTLHINPDVQLGSGDDTFNGTLGDDYIVALSGDDTIFADYGDDIVAGGEGDDSVSGGIGTDQLFGDGGNDNLRGRQDADILVGGRGDDTLQGDTGDDVLDGGDGNDTLLGGSDDDVLRGGDGDDVLDGNRENDELYGDAGNDDLQGNFGDDRLDGGSGDDSLNGFRGTDQLFGGSGNDLLIGGPGDDLNVGGSGDDEFRVAAGNDIIRYDDTPSVSDIDLVRFFDFDTDDNGANNDRFDLSDIVTGAPTSQSQLAQFIQVSPAGVGDTFLGVDFNGTSGGLSFQIIAQVENVSATELFDIDNFIF